MFACIACASFVDTKIYRFTHGSAEIWNFFWSVQGLTRELKFRIRISKHTNQVERVLPYKGLMGTCGQPGYVFRDFCLKQGIEFVIFCLNQGIGLSIFVLNGISFLGQ